MNSDEIQKMWETYEPVRRQWIRECELRERTKKMMEEAEPSKMYDRMQLCIEKIACLRHRDPASWLRSTEESGLAYIVEKTKESRLLPFYIHKNEMPDSRIPIVRISNVENNTPETTLVAVTQETDTMALCRMYAEILLEQGQDCKQYLGSLSFTSLDPKVINNRAYYYRSFPSLNLSFIEGRALNRSDVPYREIVKSAMDLLPYGQVFFSLGLEYRNMDIVSDFLQIDKDDIEAIGWLVHNETDVRVAYFTEAFLKTLEKAPSPEQAKRLHLIPSYHKSSTNLGFVRNMITK